ncbi:Plancitoxin-1 [Trichinella papuae]|uniref:Plancitoxin-1 n=1 Tax=Trichinella papuae TaxID=268474 RepID=A0A0V1N2D2_9BILA|nr:Plancitoxin-1 [Trichinella papuae]
MAVVAAWKLHTELHTATNDQLSHLEFRREITIHLLHAGPFFAKETAETNVFRAKKGYTEIVFCPITHFVLPCLEMFSEIYQKIISKQLKKTIKVWSRRDKKLKANCKIPGRQILLVSSPISVDGQASSLEKDVTNWLIPENGDIFCAIDKPYAISQKYEPAVAVCIQLANIFTLFNTIAAKLLCIFHFCTAQTSKCQVAAGNGNVDWAILYKPPGEKRGKILVAPGGAWAPNPADLENPNGHSFAKALEHVAGTHANIKFFAYNNAAPGVVGVKTKSNSKGVLILDVTGTDSAAWIVHTVPGYPKPKATYTFPASEFANGHLLICLTIAESQIEPIAAALLMASPFIHYNDVPDAEVNTRAALKKLINGETAIKPPFLTKQNIGTQAGASVPVQIFSKSERSKYGNYLTFRKIFQIYINHFVLPCLEMFSEIYQKIISKQLKKTIKVWSRRDEKLKANCKIPGKQILLVSSPISVDGQASSLEKDVTNWLIPENGDIFCAVDKPYAISQKYEPAVAVCIQLANIFAPVALFVASPFIHYNDVPDAEVRTRPTLKKLLNGETPIMPPFSSKQTIKTQAGAPVSVEIFSKSERSKYEIYQKIISKQLKKTIKVWSRRDEKLKANCKIRGRQILLVSSPISVDGQASSLEKDVTNWLIPENGDIFCAVDKPYAISQKYEPAVAVCIQLANIFARFNTIAANTSKCQQADGRGDVDWVVLYKPPGDKRGKILVPAGGAWAANPQDLENAADHSFAKALESVVGNHPAKKFFAYNNAAPGVVILDNTDPVDSAAWIVHTVPGYPKPKVAYTFPASEYANGHLLLCLTIAESQIEPIAVALFVASPFIHYNDVPDAEVRTRPTLKKLLNGETPIKPPFSSKQTIKTQAGAPVSVEIFSKSERSKYEIYQKIISKQLKKTIKVWSRRDEKLKANCKIPGRQILLVSSPISVDGQASSLEKDVTNWLIPENGDIFCAIDKPYAISQKYEPAVAVCIQLANIFTLFNTIAAKHSFFAFFISARLKHQNVKRQMEMEMAILYKPPGEKRGKILVAPGGAWAPNPVDLENPAGHSFAKALEHVAGTNGNIKFFAYNNAAPGVVGVKTKSNSKGVLILDVTGTDSAAWIVHTVPGYPKPKATYTFPASEFANGHLLICLTIAESQIEPIAAALLMASPFIHYNDVPDAEVNTRAALKKLINGETAIKPPFLTKQNIGTQAGASVPVQIFSKSERSKYGNYLTFRKIFQIYINMKEVTLLTLLIFCIFHFCIAQISKCRQADGGVIPHRNMVILYKPPGEKRGKILVAAAAAWASYPQDLHNAADHSFVKALESVSGTHANKHFFAYNNVAPGVVGVKTKSNSKGVVILDTTAPADAAAWIVHTVPGYPKPKATYTFPASEYENGHLLICLTISESQIEPIGLFTYIEV